jgi:hypothetical protein
MKDLQFSGRYQCLPIRCSGRLISLHNEHSIEVVIYNRFLTEELKGGENMLFELTAEIWVVSYNPLGRNYTSL